MKTRIVRSFTATALLGATLVLLAACDTAPKLNEAGAGAPVESRNPLGSAGPASPTTASNASPGATPQSAVTTVDLARSAAAAAATLPTQRVVYFDFDSFAIKDDYKGLIDSYARALQANKSRKLSVEGHTDERGGREYNLALGQKRAAAVVHALTLLGASDAQLEAVSFGEERPAAQGNDEAAWAKNRRAELRDR
jgi:peptidoglycan-associated lipoprotein